jgi:hypothetical protein
MVLMMLCFFTLGKCFAAFSICLYSCSMFSCWPAAAIVASLTVTAAEPEVYLTAVKYAQAANHSEQYEAASDSDGVNAVVAGLEQLCSRIFLKTIFNKAKVLGIPIRYDGIAGQLSSRSFDFQV